MLQTVWGLPAKQRLGDQQGSEGRLSRRRNQIDPGYAEAVQLGVMVARVPGDIGQAFSELNTAIKLSPDYEPAQLALGLILQQLGQPDKSVDLFKAALQQEPRSAEVHNWLGVAYAQTESSARRDRRIPAGGRSQLGVSRRIHRSGSALNRAKRFDDAIRVYHSALARAPQNVELRLNLSRASRGKGSLDAAISELRSDPKNGDDADAECEMSEILRQKHDFAGAIEASEKALALSPGMNDAYKNLGLALQAESTSRVSAQNVSKHPEPSGEARQEYDSGRELLSQGEMQGAAQEFEKAVEANPNWADAQNLLGFALGQLGQLPVAIDHLRKAVALDPTLATAHYNLGVALWYGGQRSESISELQTALRLDPAFGGSVLVSGHGLPAVRRVRRRTPIPRGADQARIRICPLLISYFAEFFFSRVTNPPPHSNSFNRSSTRTLRSSFQT